MALTKLSILLVEDNPGDARLVAEMLSRAEGAEFELTHVKRLAEAITLLERQTFDAILLDLTLPDSEGIATIDKSLLPNGTNPPVVVITGSEDEQSSLESLQHGAEDFLQKTNLHADRLIKSIKFAIERQKTRDKQDSEQEERRREQEVASLEMLGAPGTTLVTARAFGFERLSEASPDTYETLVSQYRDMIEQAVDSRRYKNERKPSQGLRVMAQRLGFLRAGPKDVVALHVEGLRRIKAEKTGVSFVVIEESRLMLIELMGNLLGYYRDHMLPMNPAAFSSQSEATREPSDK